MSSLTRSKPSFIIYRDDPANESQPTSSTAPSVTSPRPALTTSLSFNDKENSTPYPSTTEKAKGKATSSTVKSAPTSPLTTSTSEASAIRSALATKFVAPAKASKSKSKTKSSTSTSSRRAATNTATASENPSPPKIKRSHSSPTVTTRAAGKKRKAAPAALPAVAEEAESSSACGADGLTMADRRARDLTQLPLGDISEAYSTSAVPEGFAAAHVGRKRARALSTTVREPSPEIAPEGGPSSTQATQVDAEEASATAATNDGSPRKRVRLSPVARSVSLPAISTEATLVGEFPNEAREPTLVALPPSP